jgi:hypothetical protein
MPLPETTDAEPHVPWRKSSVIKHISDYQNDRRYLVSNEYPCMKSCGSARAENTEKDFAVVAEDEQSAHARRSCTRNNGNDQDSIAKSRKKGRKLRI